MRLRLPRWFLVVLALVLARGLLAPPSAVAAAKKPRPQASPPTFVTSWGTPNVGSGIFSSPGPAAVDSAGNVYVADEYQDRIQKFSPDGAFLLGFGSPGTGPGQLDGIGGVTVDTSGTIYVTDSARVSKFAPDGTFLTQWGTGGSGDGQFMFPAGVAVDATGNVYVADRGNARIEKFASNGTFLFAFGSWGAGADQQIYQPDGITLDAAGHLLVVDMSYDKVVKFASDGTFLSQWGSSGSGSGQFNVPHGVAVDGAGNIYVSDEGNNRVEKFAADDSFLAVWGTYGDGDGQFDSAWPLAVDAAGNVYVADRSRVQKFTSSGAFVRSWGRPGNGNGMLYLPDAVAVDASGHAFVADTSNNRIERFSTSGTFQLAWGSQGAGNGQFSDPQSVAVDGSGHIYVADAGNDRIEKFSSDGAFQFAWGASGTGNGQFNDPTSVAVDSAGNVYVGDGDNATIQVFRPDGTFLRRWTTGSDSFSAPAAIALDTAGNVYATLPNLTQVQEYSPNGTALTSWGLPSGDPNAPYLVPSGIAVDSAGKVYITAIPNEQIGGGDGDLVQQFTTDGTFVTSWGAPGIGNGQFLTPTGAAVDPAGNLYVADTYNDRIQKFAPATTTATGGDYHALAPTRILDTRPGSQVGPYNSPFTTGLTRCVGVAGQGGVPATGVAAVVLNVAVTDTTSPGFLTLYPAGQTRPTASNLNWSAGETIPNLVIVPVGADGQVCVYNALGNADVVIDLEGWFDTSGAAMAGHYQPLAPKRILDTRPASQIGPYNTRFTTGLTRSVQITGQGGVPASGVAAVILNVAVTDTDSPGFLTAYPAGQQRPTASNLNWSAGQTIPNRVIVPVGTGGQIDLYNALGDADVIIDVNGWFSDGGATATSVYTPLPPSRILDTRAGSRVGQYNTPFGTGTTRPIPIGGQGGVPASGVAAVVLDAAVTDTNSPGFLTLYPTGISRPNASDLNWSAGVTIANLAVTQVGPDGDLNIYNALGNADVVLDVEGYFH